jgi:hypothetical protein
MRLWSLHPKYLDAKGLTALWREALLARAVLEGKTKGYTRHPQLERFRLCGRPVAAINLFLKAVHEEACRRGYCFNAKKLKASAARIKIPVTSGQLGYEARHLLKKLKKRDRTAAKKLVPRTELNPVFSRRKGGVEKWEKIQK